ncbi:MAG: DUF5661 family protein [Candidatus Thorarchaeota archaeon]
MSKIIRKISKFSFTELRDFVRSYPNIFRGHSENVSQNTLFTFAKNRLTRRNVIIGGKGDNLTYDQVILKELDMGIKIEYEHTKDYWKAVDITFDHLAEIPDYNSRLNRLEYKGENYWKGKNRQKIIDKKNGVY